MDDDVRRAQELFGEAFRERYHCAHEQTELRRRTYSNGVQHYVRQCLRCGQMVRAVKKTEALAESGGQVPEFDERLRERWWAGYQAEWREQQQRRLVEQRLRHQAYLLGEEWRRRRDLRLRHDRYECQARLDGCAGRATEVHHLTYRHWGNEPLFDLVSVCRSCHEQITEMERLDESAS